MLSIFMGLSLIFVTNTGVSTGHHGGDQQGSGQSKTGYGEADQNYTLAYKKSVEEEKPLMVVVGAEWCPACDVLKKTTIKNMEQTGELDQVSVAVVDRDEEPELANELLKNEKMIPQIIFFHKNADGRWSRNQLKGYQPVQPVRSLLRRIGILRRG
ncbi:MAG: thioredoxin family protein [Planctomycetota bacterium]